MIKGEEGGFEEESATMKRRRNDPRERTRKGHGRNEKGKKRKKEGKEKQQAENI